MSCATTPSEIYVRACTSHGCRPNRTLVRGLPTVVESLASIDLNINVIGKNGANAVIDLVAASPQLTRLLLADNYLTNENIGHMVTKLRSHPSLTEIDLQRNPISHAAGKMLNQFVIVNRRIVKINLQGTLINPALIRLIESGCNRNAQPQPAPAPAEAFAPAAAPSEEEKAATKADDEVRPSKEEAVAPAAHPHATQASSVPGTPTPREVYQSRVLHLISANIEISEGHSAVRILLASAGIASPVGGFRALSILHVCEARDRRLYYHAGLNVLWDAAQNGFIPKYQPPQEPAWDLAALAADDSGGACAGLQLLALIATENDKPVPSQEPQPQAASPSTARGTIKEVMSGSEEGAQLRGLEALLAAAGGPEPCSPPPSSILPLLLENTPRGGQHYPMMSLLAQAASEKHSDEPVPANSFALVLREAGESHHALALLGQLM